MRKASINRKTGETDVSVSLNLDGKGKYNIATGCGFLDHMLSLFSKHSGFDLDVKCKGDTDVDFHHSTEDIAIALGQVFLQALGDKSGIMRFSDRVLPMDEALIMVAVDISGRSYLGFDCDIPQDKVGDFDTELCEEFWQGFVRNAEITMHINKLKGANSHHIIEAVFKASAQCLSDCVRIDEKRKGIIPSTKGVL